jgi:DNA-3-methyladenine glycosylase I
MSGEMILPRYNSLMNEGISKGTDRRHRCWWGADSDDYREYHDHEWGYPVDDDVRLFEKICLEGFQSGLSWLTILRKRENFRRAFRGFDFHQVARFDESHVECLLQDAGIVRHRRKIESTINNARRACELEQEFVTLAAYFWGFEPPVEERPPVIDKPALLTLTWTATSTALSKDLKQRGWSFIGPTTAYAFMQAMGLVNDHLEGCHARRAVAKARRAFQPPTRSK